jgi:hypothetical protein
MLQILNRTRLRAALALQFDAWGRELVTVAAKGTFTIPTPGDQVRVAEEQLEPLAADKHHGEPGASSVKYPADLVPGKGGTDVLLVGTAKPPGSRPVQRLEVSVRVGPLARSAIVTGDRHWERQPFGPGFQVSQPVPFHEMPLAYERAFGGRDPAAPSDDAGWDKRNPVGTGFRIRRDAVEGTPLPNIEDRAHLIGSWDDKPPVAGFGPIDGLWEPRRAFAGTYDAEWQASQAPLLPRDFDVRYFNVAPWGLAANGFLRGSEIVELTNVGGEERTVFELPIANVALSMRVGNAVSRRWADLWTILFEPTQRRVSLTWGGTFMIGKQPQKAYSVEVVADGPMSRELTSSAAA